MVHQKRLKSGTSSAKMDKRGDTGGDRETESEAVAEYKSSLNDLSFNSKPLISMLTMLADDYKNTAAPEIVKCIESRLHEVSPERKLPILYLMDSICKNITGDYVKLFTQNIVSTFCHVFEKADEKTRSSMYKLRQTWTVIFPVKKLYAIDLRISQQLDPAWPVTAKPEVPSSKQSASLPVSKKSVVSSEVAKVKQQQVHINPKFLDPKQQNKIPRLPGPETDTIQVQLIKKQQELLDLQKQKIELELMTEKRKLKEQERVLREKEEKLKQKEQLLEQEIPGQKGKKRAHSREAKSPESPEKKNALNKWVDNRLLPKSRNSPSTRNTSRSPPGNRNARLHYYPHQKGQSPGRLRGAASSPQPHGRMSNNSNIPLQLKMTSTAGPSLMPTTIPGPCIMPQADLMGLTANKPVIVQPPSMGLGSRNQRPDISSLVNPASNLGPNIIQSTQGMGPGPRTVVAPWGQDRDYRREFDDLMFEADKRLRSGALSSHDHNVLVREMERRMQKSWHQPPNTLQPTPQDEKEMTMLVDGKLRKLYYLDDSTALVLMNAPENACSLNDLIKMDPKQLDPRQISFEGKPTKLFIDSDRGNNDFVLLEFNNQHQTFFHNEHEQRIKFGGPAREIILNDKPYAAKFGGPPIEVLFNGDNLHTHTLRLEGPPPRVKLSEGTRYDLWNKLVNPSDCSSHKMDSEDTPTKPAININELLRNLVAHGMIDGQKEGTRVPSPVPNHLKSDERSLSPLIHDEDSQLPPEPSIEFTPESLKIFRPSLVASLYNGIQCTNCSLRFDYKESVKSKYSKHLDWHFRQNRKDKNKPGASLNTKRQWLYPLNLWLQYKEVDDDDDNVYSQVFDSERQDNEKEAVVATVTASDTDDTLNQCTICCEKFEMVWFEDEEEWRLKNAVTHEDGKNYHPLCLADLPNHKVDNELNRESNVSDNVNSTTLNLSNVQKVESDDKEIFENINSPKSESIIPLIENEIKTEVLEDKNANIDLDRLTEPENENIEMKLELPEEIDSKVERLEIDSDNLESSAVELESPQIDILASISLNEQDYSENHGNETELTNSPVTSSPLLPISSSPLTTTTSAPLNTIQIVTKKTSPKKAGECPVVVRDEEISAFCSLM